MKLYDAAEGDLWTWTTGGRWQVVVDGVMGGLSEGSAAPAVLDGRPCLRLRGIVRLENNGGFVQLAADVPPAPPDSRGVRLEVRGPPERYNVHLRTTRISRPWQSYRQPFETDGSWQILELPWSGFRPHRTDAPFRPDEIRRIGLVAIGRAFEPDLAVARVEYMPALSVHSSE